MATASSPVEAVQTWHPISDSRRARTGRFSGTSSTTIAGIAHLESKRPQTGGRARRCFAIVRLDSQSHNSLAGKLDGVAKQIDQDLPELAFIGANPRREIAGAFDF